MQRFATSEVFRTEHLPNFRLAFPARPVLLVSSHKRHRPSARLFLRFQFKLRVATDNPLGRRERPVDYRYLPIGKPDTGPQRAWAKCAAANHSVTGLFAELVYLVHQRLRRMPRLLARFNDHHEFHLHISFHLVERLVARLGLIGKPSPCLPLVTRNRYVAIAMLPPAYQRTPRLVSGSRVRAGFINLAKLTFPITHHLHELLPQLNVLLLGFRP